MITQTQSTTTEPVDYHSRFELSSTQIAAFLEDRIKWHHQHQVRDWPKDEPTAAMRFGFAIHKMLEIGTGPDSIAVDIPRDVLNADGHCRGNAWTAFKACFSDGVQFIKPGELNPYKLIWESLMACEFTRTAIEQGTKEQELFWTDSETGIQCRMRADVIMPWYFLDWKTTASLDIRAMQSDFYRRHYDIRLAFYRRGLVANGHTDLKVVIGAIHNKPGFGVLPIELSPQWMEQADARLTKTLLDISTFDILDEANPEPIMLSAPNWARYDAEYELEDDNELANEGE